MINAFDMFRVNWNRAANKVPLIQTIKGTFSFFSHGPTWYLNFVVN